MANLEHLTMVQVGAMIRRQIVAEGRQQIRKLLRVTADLSSSDKAGAVATIQETGARLGLLLDQLMDVAWRIDAEGTNADNDK